MKIVTVAALVGLLILAFGTPPLHAEHTQDMEAFVKWGAAEDVHYDVVAEYAGTTPILAIGGQLELTGKRTYAEGFVPAVLPDTKGCQLYPSSAKTEPVTLKVDVYPGTLLALQTPGGTVTVLKDGKTLIAKEPDGWTRMYTLKLVK